MDPGLLLLTEGLGMIQRIDDASDMVPDTLEF